MSIGSILSVARSAMQVQQVAMQTTGQNIANANVAGYSVQRVEEEAQTSQMFPYGSVGTGVQVQTISRARDALLDGQFRDASASTASATTSSDLLSRIQGVLAEPSSTGLSSALDAFWGSWSDLASDPTSQTARSAVAAQGSAVANMFHSFSNQLDAIDASARSGVTSEVSKINDLAKQVSQLNPAIVAAESNGQTANDLRDQRDRVLDQLSALGTMQTVERSDGSDAVYLSGQMIVDHDTTQTVSVTGGTPVNITIMGQQVIGVGGSVGAGLDVINNQLPTVRNGLDQLAGAVVREVNALQLSGTAYSGNPPVAKAPTNFFSQNGAPGTGDPAQTARGISLDASMSDLTNIAASGATATGPGNNDVANQVAALRDTPVNIYDASGAVVASTTMGDFYSSSVSKLAVATNKASTQVTVQQTLQNQASNRRDSVTGVSTDDELVSLMKQQQAYAAAARLVSVVDQMSQSLLAIVTS